MKKTFTRILFFTLLACATPVYAETSISAEPMESAVVSEVSIKVSDCTLYVENAAGEVLRVYSITGQQVMVVRITSDSQQIELNGLSRGCYIIKVGKTVRKIALPNE